MARYGPLGLIVQLEYIDSSTTFQAYCERIAPESILSFDTEFVSEDCYRPKLCLLQVATPKTLAIIDPLAVTDITRFWELLTDGQRTVIAHAGREESLFCFRAIGKPIQNLFDIQIAAGFMGIEFPASLGNLCHRFLRVQLDKDETRSDWRRRPLSDRQLKYAALDVEYLPTMYDKIYRELMKRNRYDWAIEEMNARHDQVIASETSDGIPKVGGMQNLQPRPQLIAFRLWQWREELAKSRDIPARRVLRDDLLIELAKMGSSDPKRILSIRGMNHRHLRGEIDGIVDVIQKAKRGELLPQQARQKRNKSQPSSMLTQFLAAALAQVCRISEVAPSLVGTSEDLREFANWRLASKSKSRELPRLSTGWRKKVVGSKLEDLLLGRLAIKIENPLDDIPITFCEPREASESERSDLDVGDEKPSKKGVKTKRRKNPAPGG